MRILLSGGGTSGHINPAIAIANYISSQNEEAVFLFVGAKHGYESTLVPKSGYRIKFIDITGFKRTWLLRNVKVILKLVKSLFECRKILKEFSPDVVLGTGGYVCGPVLYMAHLLKIPTIIHECNTLPGLTSKLSSKWCDIVSLAFDETKLYLNQSDKIKKKCRVVGNPIRPSILNCNLTHAKQKLAIDSRPLIVVFSGSLGAKYFNAVIAKWLCKIAEKAKVQVLVSTGKNCYLSMTQDLKAKGIDKYSHIKVVEYIDDMDMALNCADLLISRSGAGAVSEITALGKPSILVPSPYVTDNHQEFNARIVEKVGGAKLILEKDLTSDLLETEVDNILNSHAIAQEMSKKARSIGIADASKSIYDIMLEITQRT